MKRIDLALAALMAALFFTGCQTEPEPKEITPKESIDTAAIVDSGFVTAQDGTQKMYAQFYIEKTDNIKNKELTIRTVRSGMTELAKEYKFTSSSGYIYVTGPEVIQNPPFSMGETTVFTFFYDDTYSKSVTVPFETPVVKKAGVTSDSSSITVSWDNSVFAGYSDFIEGVHIEVKNDSETVLADTNVGFATSKKIEGLDSSKPYTITLYTMSSDNRSSEKITLGPVYPGVTPDYSCEQLIWELKNNGSDETVSIHNGANKTFYIVETNSTNIKTDTQLYAEGITKTGAVSRSAFVKEEPVYDEEVFADKDGTVIKYFEDPGIDLSGLADFEEADQDDFGFNASESVVECKVGDSKYIYVIAASDKDGKETSKAMPAHLRAQTEHCNAWIVDAYEGNGGGIKITSKQAEDFCKVFEQLYALERNIFGEESNKLVYSRDISTNSVSLVDMASYSNTGTKVNLVFYDIYEDGEKTGTITLGYFYSRDYLYKYNYSNNGKYLYIDTYCVNTMLEKTQSTIAHEYQHMINFSVKAMRSMEDKINGKRSTFYVNPYNWYTEMSSMLAEDMLQKKLGLEDAASPKNRIGYFNSYYMNYGMTYWDNSDSLPHYARCYGFGAYLARKYGGAAFVKDYMSDPEDDIGSLVRAAQKRDPSVTEDILLRDFAAACINRNKNCTELASFMRDAEKTITLNGYEYPMTAFNPWKYYQIKDTTQTGPLYYNGLKSETHTVNNHGIQIRKIGYTRNNDIKITIKGSTVSKDGLKAYIMAVPD